MNFFKLLLSYLRRLIKEISLLLLFSVIFAVVFYLNNLPIDAVVYSSILCIFVGIILIIIDFYIYYQRHKVLYDLKDNIDISIEQLPNSTDIIENDYIELIKTLYYKNSKIISDYDIAKSDMIDYYTLWAHQIKTPISAINLLLQTDQNNQNLEMILELFKVEQYVDMVLQYLRIDSMSSDLLLKQYDLNDIIKQVIRKYSKMFIIKKISLNFEEINCKVLTDEKWLTFLIEQILSNALKYTNEGSISIYLDKDKEKTLVIEDTGIGIQEEDLPRVFEKGFTGYNGRTNKKSTGIGLYLCHRISTKLSHKITIESKIDKGTKVKIDLATVELKHE